MISHFLPIRLGEPKPSILNKLGYILGDMNHLKVHFEFGILVFEGMVAMRRRNKDFLDAIIDKSFDVFPGQALK